MNNAQNYHPILVQFDQIKRIRTKNGQNMAFVTLNDGLHLMDGVIFPDQFKKYELELSEEHIYVIQGKFDKRNGKNQLIINDIYSEEAFETHKLTHSNQIIVRHIEQAKGFEQYIDQEKTKQTIEVQAYDDESKRMSRIGFINKNSENMRELIQLFKPSDIRFI